MASTCGLNLNWFNLWFLIVGVLVFGFMEHRGSDAAIINNNLKFFRQGEEGVKHEDVDDHDQDFCVRIGLGFGGGCIGVMDRREKGKREKRFYYHSFIYMF